MSIDLRHRSLAAGLILALVLTLGTSGPAHAEAEDPAFAAFFSGRYLEALKLAKQDAKRGEPQAPTLIGRIYAEGLGVPQDKRKAAEWYATGVERGDPDAQFALGMMRLDGDGISKNLSQAAALLKLQRNRVTPRPPTISASCMFRGAGVDLDFARAAELFRQAAETGNPQAQYDLARFIPPARAYRPIQKKLPTGPERPPKPDLRTRSLSTRSC